MALISCILPALGLGLWVWVAAFYRAVRDCDLISFHFFGKVYSFENPLPQPSWGTPAPSIRPVNEFLAEFANSPERTVAVTPADVEPGSTVPPLLRALQGVSYERIRLRLRVVSCLDPVVNQQAEEGTIQFTRQSAPGVFQEFKLRSRFAAKGAAILLEKL